MRTDSTITTPRPRLPSPSGAERRRRLDDLDCDALETLLWGEAREEALRTMAAED